MSITARQAQLRLARSLNMQNEANIAILRAITALHEGKDVDAVINIANLAAATAELGIFNDQLLKELEEDEQA